MNDGRCRPSNVDVMRSPLAVFGVFLAAALLVAASSPARAGARTGDRAPEFVKVQDEKGRRVSLKSFKDRVVVLTFGASWCAPCRKEIPALDKLAGRYAARSAEVVFLAVNIDSERTKGLDFMRQLKVKHLRTVFDPKKSTVESYDPPKMPSTYIIKRGIIKHVHGGYAPGDEKKLAARIDKEL